MYLSLYTRDSPSLISSYIPRTFLQVIRPFILRRRKDEVEKYLPSKTQVILKCDLSAWQKAYYKQVTEQGRVGLSHGKGLLPKDLAAPATYNSCHPNLCHVLIGFLLVLAFFSFPA